MKEPIAVIHYTDGTDKTFQAYTADNMLAMIRHCIRNQLSYIVFVTDLHTSIPIQPSKPYKGHIAPLEYVGRVEVSKPLHGALQRSREPTLKLDHHAHANMVRKIYEEVQGY